MNPALAFIKILTLDYYPTLMTFFDMHVRPGIQKPQTDSTVFVPLAAQGAYQSLFRWALIKTLISWFFSLKWVIFEKKINGK